MDYNEFVNQLQKKLQSCLGEAVFVEYHRITKNNGIHRDCFMISEKGKNVSPAVYLDEYFRASREGMELEKIAEQICRLYQRCLTQVSFDAGMFACFSEIRNRILCRVINREKNRELLERIPFVPYLDLAIVFYVMLEDQSFGSGTVTIGRDHLRFWDVDRDTLYQIARENTKKLLPCRVCDMREILSEMLTEEEIHFYPLDKLPMYVLTNEKRQLGACGILYDSVLSDAAAVMGDSFYVLPSSIHECILVPQKLAPEPEELSAMVHDINCTQVLPEEVLSDRVYCYNARKHHLFLAV